MAVSLFTSFIFIAAAQEITGSISGRVTDKSGAAVGNANITVFNTDKNDAIVHVITSNDTGDFVVSVLPIGHYALVAESKGFKKAERRGITLNVNDNLTIGFVLEPGDITDTVTVEADASPIELQTATQSGLITGTQIRELAINTRNYEQLVALTPGVSTNLASDQLYVGVSNPLGTSNQINFSINGGRATQNNWSIDGADNVDRGANLTLLQYPSVDSIEEFRVVRGQYDAEYGRSSSGQINVITRSGTSAFHGGVYEFFRNQVLDANSFFNNASGIDKPPYHYNDFGGTIGGPILFPAFTTPIARKLSSSFPRKSAGSLLTPALTRHCLRRPISRETFSAPSASSTMRAVTASHSPIRLILRSSIPWPLPISTTFIPSCVSRLSVTMTAADWTRLSPRATSLTCTRKS